MVDSRSLKMSWWNWKQQFVQDFHVTGKTLTLAAILPCLMLQFICVLYGYLLKPSLGIRCPCCPAVNCSASMCPQEPPCNLYFFSEAAGWPTFDSSALAYFLTAVMLLLLLRPTLITYENLQKEYYESDRANYVKSQYVFYQVKIKVLHSSI